MQKWLLIISVIFSVGHWGVCFAQSKPVLVVFPIEVDQDDARYTADFGIALQQGLATRYEVYYGPDVENELEKEYSKLDCSAEQCRQNIAIAFNGELVANASAQQVGSGYLLKLAIRNVFTGKIVESHSLPCRECDVFAVVEAFKAIGTTAPTGEATAIAATSSPASATLAAASKNTPSAIAEQHYQNGQNAFFGRGVKQSYSHAISEYQKAAALNHALAQLQLGMMYELGRGVRPSDAEAASWYRKAAELGNEYAQHDLAVLYAEGRGLEQSNADAKQWFNEAAAQGNQPALSRLEQLGE